MSGHDDSELTVPEKIQENATLVIQLMRENAGVELHYDEASVKWIDEYIERHRKTWNETWDQSRIDGLVSMLGSFVGECIRREYGGEWEALNERWGILFSSSNMAFPFAKIMKQIADGHEGGESTLGFYRTTSVMRNYKRAEHMQPSGSTDEDKTDS